MDLFLVPLFFVDIKLLKWIELQCIRHIGFCGLGIYEIIKQCCHKKVTIVLMLNSTERGQRSLGYCTTHLGKRGLDDSQYGSLKQVGPSDHINGALLPWSVFLFVKHARSDRHLCGGFKFSGVVNQDSAQYCAASWSGGTDLLQNS